MPLYFSLLDADRFHRELRPPLSASWRRRSFEPCRPLCATLAPLAADFAARYHTGADEPLLTRIANGRVGFDRDLWRLLVGETLLYGAVDVPEVPTAPDTLTLLLAPEVYERDRGPREAFAAVEQVHYGARDLVFGGGYYRPGSAGYNDTDDVARLAAWLDQVAAGPWDAISRARIPGQYTSEEWAEEIGFVREVVLPALRQLYYGAETAHQVIICEVV